MDIGAGVDRAMGVAEAAGMGTVKGLSQEIVAILCVGAIVASNAASILPSIANSHSSYLASAANICGAIARSKIKVSVLLAFFERATGPTPPASLGNAAHSEILLGFWTNFAGATANFTGATANSSAASSAISASRSGRKRLLFDLRAVVAI